jgi:hypothetical protein
MENINDKIDELELAMQDYPTVDCPLIHRFTPGVYIREIIMYKNSLVTSQVHALTHPFFVLAGEIIVYSENDGEQFIEAPYSGTTLPGTRRVLKIVSDAIWVTIHALPWITGDENMLGEKEKMELVDKIESMILIPYENKLLGGRLRNNKIVKSMPVNELKTISQ